MPVRTVAALAHTAWRELQPAVPNAGFGLKVDGVYLTVAWVVCLGYHMAHSSNVHVQPTYCRRLLAMRCRAPWRCVTQEVQPQQVRAAVGPRIVGMCVSAIELGGMPGVVCGMPGRARVGSVVSCCAW